jgi:ABC-type Fe3+/spermidine/putrescine transport system ATPase subunit
VAEFTGATNILRGRVDRFEDRVGVVRLEGGLEIRCPADGAPSAGSAVALSLRPENLSVEPGGDSFGNHPNTWPGTVVKAEFLGAHSIYRVQVGGETLTAVALGSAPNLPERTGVTLHIAPGRVSLLGQEGQEGASFPRS